MKRAPLAALLAVAFLVPFATARADGEAGLVIQNGDQVQTYCVAFKGDSITGSDLLISAGIAFEQFGGSARTLCSIGDTGCHGAGSFDSCFCQCNGGNCTYWAFFTEKYGQNWIYASLAFNILRARDGDLHGWKWGKGSPNSAPVPAAATFETVCGHGPRGGVALPPTPVATARPPAATEVPTLAATTNPRAAASAQATPSVEASASASATAPVSPTPLAELTVAATPRPTTAPTVAAPASGGSSGADSGGGSPAGLIAFGTITVALAAAAGVIAWRRRNGA